MKSSELFAQTPESILKMVAKTFLDIPSILRKRRTGVQAHLTPYKVVKVNGENHTSNGE